VTDRGDADAWALLLRAWSAALATYRRRAWEDALAQFEAIVRDYSGDGPGRAYVARCRGFAATPPPPDWDGVHEATAK